jgi:predicted aspartyl protease
MHPPLKRFFVITVLAMAGWCSNAQAQDCKPLELVTHLKMERDDGGLPMLPVSINGTPRRFLLDTGGALTQISLPVVEDLKLRQRESPAKLYDVNGNVSNRLAIVDDFALGPLKGQNVTMQVDDVPNAGMDGILTQALFPNFDMDLDFGPDRFAFFAQGHCGRVVYWKAAAVAVVPISKRSLHLNLTVTIDGKQMDAIIDTGATNTYMDMGVARRVFGITPETPGVVQDGHVNDDPDLPVYHRTFSTLSFEGITIQNPRIAIADENIAKRDKNDGFETGSHVRKVSDRIERTPLTIGMNILRKLHMFIAFKEGKIYITPAGAPDSPSPFDGVAPK